MSYHPSLAGCHIYEVPDQTPANRFFCDRPSSALLIGWPERYAWRQADQLQTRFEAMQRSGYHPADHMEATILRMNAVLLRFDLREDPAGRDRFQMDAQALTSWLAQHQTNAVSYRQCELLEQV